MSLNKVAKRFLMGEAFESKPSLRAYIQSIEEALSNISPRTKSGARKLEVARSHIREVRRQVRRMEEQIAILEETNKALEEELSILEEGSDE